MHTGNHSESSKLVPEKASKKTEWKFIGYVCGFMNVLVYPASLGTAQALGDTVPTFQLMTFRYVALFLSSAVFCRVMHQDLRVVFEKENLPFIAGYMFLQVGHHVTEYVAVKYIAVTTVICLKQGLEVAMTFMITLLFITRSCKVPQTVSALLCVVGVIVLTQPEFIFSNKLSQYEKKTRPLCGRDSHIESAVFNYSDESFRPNLTLSKGNDASEVYPGYVLSCATPLMNVGIYFIGSGPLKHINPFVVLFWESVCGMISMSLTMLIFESPSFPVGATCISLLCGHLGCFVINHTCFTVALMRIQPAVLAVLTSLQLVVGLCAQYTVLKHINPGHKNALEIIGAVIVILGNIAGPFYEIYRLRTESSDPSSVPDRHGDSHEDSHDSHEDTIELTKQNNDR